MTFSNDWIYLLSSLVFHLQMLSFKIYVSFIYIQLSLGNRVANFLGKGFQLCLSSVFVVAV